MLYLPMNYDIIIIYLYIFIFLSVSILNGCTDFEKKICIYWSGSLKGLDSQLDPVGPTRRRTQKVFSFWFLLTVKLELKIIFLLYIILFSSNKRNKHRNLYLLDYLLIGKTN